MGYIYFALFERSGFGITRFIVVKQSVLVCKPGHKPWVIVRGIAEFCPEGRHSFFRNNIFYQRVILYGAEQIVAERVACQIKLQLRRVYTVERVVYAA